MPKVYYFSFLFFFGCASSSVVYDYDRTADFKAYNSFRIVQWKQADTLINQFDKERIINSVKSEMMDRGHAVEERNPKLAVTLFLKLNNKTTTTAYVSRYQNYGYSYYPGWGWGSGMTTTTYEKQHYTVGTLVVDVYDTSTKKLIWQGVSEGIVDGSPATREKGIPKEIALIFKKYPKAKIDQ